MDKSDLIYIDGTTVKLLLNADSVFVETDDFDITNTSTSDIQSSDLDNQGDKEVIITDDEKVTVAKKTEDTGYVVSSTIETTGDVLLELGDVDGDTYMDIILANTNGLIQVLKNDGTGEMTVIFSFNVDSQFQSVRLTDIDWDWDLDLEIVYLDSTQIHFNDGTGNFQ